MLLPVLGRDKKVKGLLKNEHFEVGHIFLRRGFLFFGRAFG